MKLEDWLAGGIRRLRAAGVATARLDCLVLLEDELGKDRAQLLAHPEASLPSQALKKLNERLKRRQKHEPLAYIRGKSEFYGREFIVNKHTLEPRPETETMIELLKQFAGSKRQTQENLMSVIDVGTGSGCLAITAKLEIPELEVFATDISEECLQTARQNAQKLGADVKFYQGDLLQPLLSVIHYPPSALLANLPYVPDSHTINQAAMQEPKLAIFGGEDGLRLYQRMFTQLKAFKHQPCHVLTESLPFQHSELAKIGKSTGYKLIQTDDFIQVFQFIKT